MKDLEKIKSESMLANNFDAMKQQHVSLPNNNGTKDAFLKDFAELCEKHGLHKVYWMEDKSAKTSTSAYHICALYLSNGEEINSAELLKAMNVR